MCVFYGIIVLPDNFCFVAACKKCRHCPLYPSRNEIVLQQRSKPRVSVRGFCYAPFCFHRKINADGLKREGEEVMRKSVFKRIMFMLAIILMTGLVFALNSCEHKHTYDKWTQTLAPTCTEKGSEVRNCKRCEYFETREIAALGHQYSAEVTPPTSGEQGYTTHTCARCLDRYVDTYVPATGSIGLAYEVNSNGSTCTIVGIGTCTDADVYIPATIDGYSVTKIAASAFENCSNITSVTVGNGVENIGEGAFSGCSNLESVTLPFVGESVKSFHRYPFGYVFGTSSYEGGVETQQFYGSKTSPTQTVYYIPSGLKSVIITGGNIYYGAFSNCKDLESITIPNDITKIDDAAFSHCQSLTSFVIPNGVESIGEGAFSGCTSLISITIPDSVTKLGESAFVSCQNLTSVTIPGSVALIESYAFEYCSSLTNITISDGVTRIGFNTFANCTALESITLPNSVIKIGIGAFSNCTKLKNITLSQSLEAINSKVFDNCDELTSLTIPASVTRIDFGAFDYCFGLMELYFEGTVAQFEQIVDTCGRFGKIGIIKEWQIVCSDGTAAA